MGKWKLSIPDRQVGLIQFPNCPSNIFEDYKDAKSILDKSPRAAAAFARRALQAIFHHKGIKAHNLATEIDLALNSSSPETALPGYLAQTVDIIRAYGNFGAHPIAQSDTGTIIPVETHEADHCILVVEELIDFYFERPKITADRRAAANAKLAAAGKGALKGPTEPQS